MFKLTKGMSNLSLGSDGEEETLITNISEVCIDFAALDIQDSKDEKFEDIPLGTESEKKSNKESAVKNGNEEVRVSIGDLESESVKEKFVHCLRKSCSLL